jgi:predicted transcriptional regulator
MSDPVKTGVSKKEQRVTLSVRVPPKVRRELERLGKRKYQTMSTFAADVLVEFVKRMSGLEGR